uniref:(northern house mosquito) hypothetical protein n=1 Tax=Culex pipiens TaxID=7175 RepID=A0A8D8ILC5_CULPI
MSSVSSLTFSVEMSVPSWLKISGEKKDQSGFSGSTQFRSTAETMKNRRKRTLAVTKYVPPMSTSSTEVNTVVFILPIFPLDDLLVDPGHHRDCRLPEGIPQNTLTLTRDHLARFLPGHRRSLLARTRS